jgi:predicted PurR-regulated permease PerM
MMCGKLSGNTITACGGINGARETLMTDGENTRTGPGYAARFAAYLAILGAAALLLWFLGRITMVLAYFGVAIVVTYLLNPFVDALERRRVPRSLSILVMFVVFVIVAGSASAFLATSVQKEIVKLVDAVPQYQETAVGLWRQVQGHYDWLKDQSWFEGFLQKATAAVQEFGGRIATRTFQGVMSFFSVAMGMIVVPVLVFYFLKDDHTMRASFISALPAPWRADGDRILDRINEAIGGFIRGQLKLCLAMGVLTWAGMAVIGLDYALIMGLIAGATEFIPYMGPILGIIMPVIVAAFEGPDKLAAVGVAFVILQVLEGNILAPRIMSGDVGIHPVIIIFVLMAGGQVGGIGGMIIALPAAVILKVFFEHFYIDKFVKPSENTAPAPTKDEIEAAGTGEQADDPVQE